MNDKKRGWSDYEIHVLKELERISKEQEIIKKTLQDFTLRTTSDIIETKTKLNQRSSLFGAISGTIAALLGELIRAVLTNK